MEQILDFIDANPWLCIGLGVIAVVIVDEALGVSRLLTKAEPPSNKESPPPEEPAPQADNGVEDLIPRR